MNESISVNSGLSRLFQLDAAQWRQPITANRCLLITEHRDEYFQLEHDNPNLIWLYTLILQDKVGLPQGEIISAMKQRLLEEDFMTPLAWRYIANGKADDFRVVLDLKILGNDPQWRWKTLLVWLRLLSCLRLETPVPEPIQELFLHDDFRVEHKYGEVLFRSTWMRFDTLRHILEEADRRLAAGTLREFAETELVEVITWLGATCPSMDNNQTKNSWKYLLKNAAEWKADTVKAAVYQDVMWESAMPKIQVDNWTVEPVTDAWSLHRLAISQRHCADRFVEGCLAGKDRIFEIRNHGDKTVATLRLTLDDGSWFVGDIRGFANAVVPDSLSGLGKKVARRYSAQAQS